MSRVVLAAGTSHTPLLNFSALHWAEYSKRDVKNKRLNTSDGQYRPYDELLAQADPKHAAVATTDTFKAKELLCHAALDRMAADIEAAAPDVVIILTDDESELFSRANTPAVSVYYGETIITRPFSSKQIELDTAPVYFEDMIKGYAMDEPRSFPAMADFGRELIERLIIKHIDVGAAAQIEEPLRSGFGHGIGFVIDRLFGGRAIPVIPILFNTYYAPNAPLPARCFDIGRALREAIDESPQDLRVAVIASGGLSHFVVDEDLDHKVLQAFRTKDAETLRSIPVQALNAGSSEIRNWIAMAGTLEGMELDWLEYQPLYRTAAGTGVGTAFGVWRPA
jgi:hypothetical protein